MPGLLFLLTLLVPVFAAPPAAKSTPFSANTPRETALQVGGTPFDSPLADTLRRPAPTLDFSSRVRLCAFSRTPENNVFRMTSFAPTSRAIWPFARRADGTAPPHLRV